MLFVVANNGLAVVRQPQSRQLFGNPSGIAVEDVPQQQLCAHAQDFNTRFSHAVRQGPQDQQEWSKGWCSSELAHVAAGDG